MDNPKYVTFTWGDGLTVQVSGHQAEELYDALFHKGLPLHVEVDEDNRNDGYARLEVPDTHGKRTTS